MGWRLGAITAVTIIVLGVNWPIMARGVELVPALWLATVRLGGSAALLFGVQLITGDLRRPRQRDLSILGTVALIRLAVVESVSLAALRFIAPGRASVVIYTSALWTVPIAAVVLRERLTAKRLVAVAIGTAGLVTLMRPWASDSDPSRWIGICMLIVSAFSIAVTTVHVRAHRWGVTPWQVMPWALAIATLPVGAVALAIDGAPRIEPDPSTLLLIAYEVVAASAFGLWGLLTVSRELPAMSTSILLMAIPVVGLASSIVVGREHLESSLIVGSALVAAGVIVGTRTHGRADRPRRTEPDFVPRR
jgi:O-acetylserine/cysteine efflux transporter